MSLPLRETHTYARSLPKFRKSEQEENGRFQVALERANEELRYDVISAIADSNAIVVVASDHGAGLFGEFLYDDRYLSAAALVDRYGSMCAVRWPQGFKQVLDVICSQNIMLEVMIYLTGDKSLAKYKKTGRTFTPGIDRIPIGAIDNGVIQVGPDSGKSLFLAAEAELSVKECTLTPRNK